MSGRILIIDSVATNRIVLKAKVMAAQYVVDACATCADATAKLATHRPDLLLINLTDPTEDRHQFCRDLRVNTETRDVPILSVGAADTARSRFAALDAGADDVLPRPVSDVLLLARIRSLLRRRNMAADLHLHDGTGRALGFEEAGAPRLTPPRINILSDNRETGLPLLSALQSGLSQAARLMTTQMARTLGRAMPSPDLFVIDGTQMGHCEDQLYQLVSDLHARIDSRGAAQLVVVPKSRPDMAALALDLGADDVVFSDVAADELTLRARQLVSLKSQQDSLRDRVRSGLHAAVTDPLTGLHNRRYAEIHIKRIADQAKDAEREYALMMLDIDHFKAINDTYGHSAGDRVLLEMADRLRENIRTIDLVARMGGEEFLIAMPDTAREEAEFAAERLRKLIHARPFSAGGDAPDLRVTVSVGVAVCGSNTPHEVTHEQLFAQADAALYNAKSAGRNTIVMSRAVA